MILFFVFDRNLFKNDFQNMAHDINLNHMQRQAVEHKYWLVTP